jgi:pimeloyl-ACP methyl ester carboxylesterase
MFAAHRFLLLVLLPLFARCQREEITFSTAADQTFYVQQGDAKLRVQVRGNTQSGKIILTVHGGPGGSSYYLSYLAQMQREVEPHAAVAYWDQPLAGASQGNRADVTIAGIAESLRKVVTVLRHRYGPGQKIILFSESWGGLIATAFLTAGDNQQLVQGWINADGPHDFHLMDREIIRMAIATGESEIAKGNHVDTWREIVAYCRNHDPAGNYAVSRRLNELLGEAEYLIDTVVRVEFNTPAIFWQQAQRNQAPFTALLFNLLANSYNQVEKEAYKSYFAEKVGVIRVPLLLLWGKYDFIAPPAVADSLYQRVQSPIKLKVLLQRSGHNGFLQEPDVFWPAFRQFVDQR